MGIQDNLSNSPLFPLQEDLFGGSSLFHQSEENHSLIWENKDEKSIKVPEP